MRAYTAKCKIATGDLTPTIHSTILGKVWRIFFMNHLWIIRELISPELFDDISNRKNFLL
jgi:hypothetical protein